MQGKIHKLKETNLRTFFCEQILQCVVHIQLKEYKILWLKQKNTITRKKRQKIENEKKNKKKKKFQIMLAA